jgi:ribose transport system substrate-binding protein
MNGIPPNLRSAFSALRLLIASLALVALAVNGTQASTWDGPTTGPKAQASKFIIYVSTDQKNGGSLGAGNGVLEAAKAIGWRAQIIDGQGTVSGQVAAFGQAIALKPDGIILGGVDAVSQKTALDRANSLGIKVVGIRAGPKPGPIADPVVFTNVETNPDDVAATTAKYVIEQTHGAANVVIFTDSQYALAVRKAKVMQQTIQACKGCSVLEYVDSPIAEASQRMPQLAVSLKQRYGAKLNWMLAINDLYFDFAAPALRSAGVPPEGPPKFASAGDGSVSAYSRIRDGQYQFATVPEPLNLQGWQAVDELNRALAGAQPSGYVTKAHTVTKANIGIEGGPNNIYDPDNGYRDHYKSIWGVK